MFIVNQILTLLTHELLPCFDRIVTDAKNAYEARIVKIPLSNNVKLGERNAKPLCKYCNYYP